MGNVTSLIGQTFPPKSKFNAEDIPDLTGKVIVVTGANTGVLAKSYSQSNDDGLYSIFLNRDWKRNCKGKSSSMPTSS
jgi:hypothetical protein